MPSAIESSRKPESTEVWITERRHAAGEEEEDEARLLGRYSNEDAGAVLIGKPTSRSMHFRPPSGMPSGGPRPTNTLSNNLKSQVKKAHPVRSTLRGGETKQLQFQTSRGSNVKPVLQATHYEEEAFAESYTKRRKTSHYSSSPDSGCSADERLDQLDSATVVFGPSQAFSTHSVSSRGSVLQKPKKESIGSLTAYRNVENMMDSKPASKKQQKFVRGGQSQHQIYGLSSSPLLSSPSNPIDISGADDDDEVLDTRPTLPPRHTYQGTARKPHPTKEGSHSSPFKLIHGRFAGKKSPFFDEPNLPVPKTNDTRSQHQNQSKVRNNNEKQYIRLNDQFIPINGDRRTSGVSLSSELDELQSTGTTVGNNAHASPPLFMKRSRNNSPSKDPISTAHDTYPDGEGAETVRSNIRTSKFVAEVPKVRSDPRIIGRVREKKAPWSVELAAISTPGNLLKDDGIALVHDEKSGAYFVAANGRFTSIKIQPQKLVRVLYEDSGRKVRFVSAKSGTDDNIVDLEFRKEKDVWVLLKLHEFRAVNKVDSRPSEHMDKIFERRRSEYRTTDNSKRAALIDSHTVQHAWTSELRHEPDDQSPSHRTADATHERPKSKLVDELFDRAGLPDEAPIENLRPMRDGMHRWESVSQVVEKSKPNRNEQITRSTRASVQSKKPSADFFDDHEDYPEVERFSRIHGLGDPWKKPLTYPLVGKKKTTVEFSDLERLDEGEYLNDSLISFQLRFLEHTMEGQMPDLAKRVYFFNTFFFATLMNTHKGRKGFNYEGVQKWTRNVDLFTYDYIVVPINDSLHWYLAIICNLPALDRGLDLSEEKPDSPVEPAADASEKIKENGPTSSSPTINILEGDSVTLVAEPKEPDERGARNSFAEMTLDVHPAQPSANDSSDDQHAEAVDLAGEDEEMLDGQLQKRMPGAPNQNIAEERAKEMEGDPFGDTDQPPKAAVGLKRGKRKSMPPVTKIDPSKPAIITFDSLGLARSSTIRILRDYLREEAKAKRGGMDFDAGQIKGITASMIPLQENWYDCGLFLLGYVAKLLEEDPREFITKVIRREFDVQKDWPNLKPSSARRSIREQLLRLHDQQEAERQKGRDAHKNCKPDVKQGPQVKLGPSRAVSPARTIQQEFRDDRKGAHEAAEDPKELPSPIQPATRDNALQTALSLPPYDFAGDVKNLIQNHGEDKVTEVLMHETDQEIEEWRPKRRSQDFRAPEKAKRRERVPGSFEYGPSVVVIDSQSQQEEAPRSFRHSHPNQAANIPAKEPPELPSEIQDSQPSETSRLFTNIHQRASDTAEPPPRKKRDVQEIQAVLVENPRDSKRRKTDDKGVPVPTQRAGQKIGERKPTKERVSGLPEWAKQGFSRRKSDRRAGKVDQVIHIDD